MTTEFVADPSTLDFRNEDAPTFEGIGVISDCSLGEPFEQSGDVPVKLAVEAPEGHPDKTTYRGQITYNQERMQYGADNSDLDSNIQQVIQINKKVLNQLAVAVGLQHLGQVVAAPHQLIGARVYFKFGPRKKNPERGDFKQFGAPKS